jgi:hypothetical protein
MGSECPIVRSKLLMLRSCRVEFIRPGTNASVLTTYVVRMNSHLRGHIHAMKLRRELIEDQFNNLSLPQQTG